VVQPRIQHPPPHLHARLSPEALTWPDRLPSMSTRILQDQRRLECMQAHNTACNSYSGLKPHRTSALNLATATAAPIFLEGALASTNTPRLDQIIVYQTPTPKDQTHLQHRGNQQWRCCLSSKMNGQIRHYPSPEGRSNCRTFCGVHLAEIVSTI
jgi:hypothetical protein